MWSRDRRRPLRRVPSRSKGWRPEPGANRSVLRSGGRAREKLSGSEARSGGGEGRGGGGEERRRRPRWCAASRSSGRRPEAIAAHSPSVGARQELCALEERSGRGEGRGGGDEERRRRGRLRRLDVSRLKTMGKEAEDTPLVVLRRISAGEPSASAGDPAVSRRWRLRRRCGEGTAQRRSFARSDAATGGGGGVIGGKMISTKTRATTMSHGDGRSKRKSYIYWRGGPKLEAKARAEQSIAEKRRQ